MTAGGGGEPFSVDDSEGGTLVEGALVVRLVGTDGSIVVISFVLLLHARVSCA